MALNESIRWRPSAVITGAQRCKYSLDDFLSVPGQRAPEVRSPVETQKAGHLWLAPADGCRDLPLRESGRRSLPNARRRSIERGRLEVRFNLLQMRFPGTTLPIGFCNMRPHRKLGQRHRTGQSLIRQSRGIANSAEQNHGGGVSSPYWGAQLTDWDPGPS